MNWARACANPALLHDVQYCVKTLLFKAVYKLQICCVLSVNLGARNPYSMAPWSFRPSNLLGCQYIQSEEEITKVARNMSVRTE